MHKEKAGWIYFLSSPIVVRAGKTYKIGKTNRHPTNREAEIGLLLPVEPQIDFAIYVDDIDWWEYMFHKALEEYRIRGEWFELHERKRDDIIWELWGSGNRTRHENDVLPSDADEIIGMYREITGVSDVN